MKVLIKNYNGKIPIEEFISAIECKQSEHRIDLCVYTKEPFMEVTKFYSKYTGERCDFIIVDVI